MSDDQKLIAELHRTKETVRVYYEAHPPSGIPHAAWDHAVSPVEEDLFELVKNHPQFGQQGNRWFDAKDHHMNPSQAATLLVRKCQMVGAEHAVAWLNRMYAAERADVRHVTEVIGLHCPTAYQLSNGVKFMRFSEVPSSPMTSRYRQLPGHHVFATSLPRVAAVLELKDCPVTSFPPRRWQPHQVETSVHAHVLVSKHSAPSIGVCWVEFIDREMEEAAPRVGWGMPRSDAPIREGLGVEVTLDDTAKVESFLAIESVAGGVCEIAASRLIAARNRLYSGNKAIDGCIALEALLTDKDETGDNTYRVALRSALLLGSALEERQRIFGETRAFYNLRSRTVHGGLKTHDTDGAIAENGLRICAEVLQKIVGLRKLPNWRELELGAQHIL